MGLVDQWSELESTLPAGWGAADLVLRVRPEGSAHAAAALLGSLQPLVSDGQTLAIRIARGNEGVSATALRRGLAHLDDKRIAGTLTLASTEVGVPSASPPAAPSLGASWRSALATLPLDWSDLLGEVELDSSDYLDRAAVHLAPINPRRVGLMTTLRFRSAQHVGYGASPGMVAACLDRCDGDGIRGRVRLTRVLCDSRPVGTQGPVWQIDGEMA
jgi:hypothetical protein